MKTRILNGGWLGPQWLWDWLQRLGTGLIVGVVVSGLLDNTVIAVLATPLGWIAGLTTVERMHQIDKDEQRRITGSPPQP